MTTSFTFPTSARLQEIEQELLPRLEQDRPVFQFFPTENLDEDLLIWEQMDAYYGLQQVRGLNAEFPSAPKTGFRRFIMVPGVYGEFEPVAEDELTRRRRIGTFGEPIDVSNLVMPIQDKLLQRRLDRIEWIIWTLLANGTFSVAGPNGTIIHQDSYTTQTLTAAVPWSTAATSTPLLNFRQAKLKARGYSVDFGANALAFMNQTTLNYMLANTNAADLYGRRVTGLATANNLGDINTLLQKDDLPEIVVYDRGYRTLTNPDGTFAFSLFIPDGVVILIGKRPGNQPVGRYYYTRNANNPDLGPGPFMKVVDTGDHGRYPRELRVLDAHNGGVALQWPSAVVKMVVA